MYLLNGFGVLLMSRHLLMLEFSILWLRVALPVFIKQLLQNENEKKRAYDEHIRNIEHGTFTPLVFSIADGMGPIATILIFMNNWLL